MQFDLLVKGGEVIDPEAGYSGKMDVAVKRSHIAAVDKKIPNNSAFQVIDASGQYVTAGLIDIHAQKLIILEERGPLRIAEATPSAYKEISSCDVFEGEQKFRQFWTQPVLYKGKIYCRNYGFDLVCIDVSK